MPMLHSELTVICILQPYALLKSGVGEPSSLRAVSSVSLKLYLSKYFDNVQKVKLFCLMKKRIKFLIIFMCYKFILVNYT